MRKAIEIKALLLLSSWLIIFMHGVIPHLHASHSHYDLHSGEGKHHSDCIHHHGEEANDHGVDYYTHGSHDHNSTICHYNPNLFSQLDLDYSMIFVPAVESIIFDSAIEIINPDTQPKFKKPPLISDSALRAPPIA